LKVRFPEQCFSGRPAQPDPREHGHAHDHADQKTQRYQDGKRSLEMQEEKGDGDRPVFWTENRTTMANAMTAMISKSMSPPQPHHMPINVLSPPEKEGRRWHCLMTPAEPLQREPEAPPDDATSRSSPALCVSASAGS